MEAPQMTRNDEVTGIIAELGQPAFWGFPDEDECLVNMNFSPCGARAGGEYPTAYYSAEQVRALLAAQVVRRADDVPADQPR